MSRFSHHSQVKYCKHCKTPSGRRTTRKSWQRFFSRVGIYPFRCEYCQRKFLAYVGRR